MGNWNINIQGTGCHHNGKPDIDADLTAARFVRELQEQGHTIEAASFTSGGKVDLLSSSQQHPPPPANPHDELGAAAAAEHYHGKSKS